MTTDTMMLTSDFLTMTAVLTLIAAYLLGSIPFGVILSKLMGAGDLRQVGSGNIGATNALRTGNKKLAALTLLGDLLKGTAAVAVARVFAPDVMMLSGLVAVLGHIFPLWLRFRGGKGVATALGALLGAVPLAFVATALTWLFVFRLWRISSLSALVAFALAPLYCFFLSNAQVALVVLLMALLIFATHRENIRRLIAGEEKTFKK